MDGLRRAGALGSGRSDEGRLPAPAGNLVDGLSSAPRIRGRDSASDIGTDGAAMDPAVQYRRTDGAGRFRSRRAPVGVPVRSGRTRPARQASTSSPRRTPRDRSGAASRHRGSRRPHRLERLRVRASASPWLAKDRATTSTRERRSCGTGAVPKCLSRGSSEA
jgi:hypothetical protein